MSKRITKREYINRILSYAHEEDKPYLMNELALLDKKNSAERKPSEKDIAKRNADKEMRIAIVDEMEVGVRYSGADIAGLPTPATAELSVAKVAYLMRELVADGSVNKVVEKRHTFYELAE